MKIKFALKVPVFCEGIEKNRSIRRRRRRIERKSENTSERVSSLGLGNTLQSNPALYNFTPGKARPRGGNEG